MIWLIANFKIISVNQWSCVVFKWVYSLAGTFDVINDELERQFYWCM